MFFKTVHLRTNVKASLRNVAVFISTEQNRSYVIRRNNIKQRALCVYYFLIKRKKLSAQPNTKMKYFYVPPRYRSTNLPDQTSRKLKLLDFHKKRRPSSVNLISSRAILPLFFFLFLFLFVPLLSCPGATNSSKRGETRKG